MKRVSVWIAAMAVALIGVVSLGAGTASADVLCNTWTLTNGSGCGTVGGTVYPAGTEIKMKLVPGKQARLDLYPGEKMPEFQCGESSLYLTLTNAGSWEKAVEATVSHFSFSSCTYTPEVLSFGSASIREQPRGTSVGATTLSGTEIRAAKHIFGIRCRVNMTGAKGELVGPVWNKMGASTLTFNYAPVHSGDCGEMFFSGTYIAQSILGSPTSIYALQF